MDFLNKLGLNDDQKEHVESILEEEDLELADKLAMLEDLNLDDDDYEKIKKHLEGDESNEEEEKEKQISTDFMPLVEKKKQKIAELYLNAKKFDALRQLVDKQQNPECLERFEAFMKQQPASPAKARTPPPKSPPQPRSRTKIVSPPQNPTKVTPDKSINQNNRNSFLEKQAANRVIQNQKESDDEDSASEEEAATESEEEHGKTLLDSPDEEPSDDEVEPGDDDEEMQWKPEITPEFFKKFPDCLNILVLGETGVGKSTFINGLANYLKYNNMHEAKNRGVEILIRSSFLHFDEDCNQIKIESEPTIETEEDNEDVEDGQSSTQSPKTYQFEWGPAGDRKMIRIIDTPGVGDVRGLEQEQMNFAKILSFIADYPKIHAILILLKPNDSKLTVTYRYCVNELLTHLHASASNNILFCFTNTRGTLYQPGETLPALKAHLDTLYQKRKVKIPLNKSTVFCFDNESFRFLCAWKQGASFDKKDVEDFNMSWKKTVEETFRLFQRISELEPHDTEETLSVNNIRQVILAMARPLAEITKNLTINAQLIDEKVKEVEDLMKRGKNLRDANLFVDQIVITPIEINYPITVCTNEGCIDMVELRRGVYEPYYKQKCHPHCYLQGIQTGYFPNTQIQGCTCFSGNINECTVCGCDWTTHLHIRYELSKAMEKVQDQTVQDSIDNCDDKVKTAQIFLDTEKKRKLALENEANTISAHCAEFAAFLKKHSIIPYNDVYKEYVEHLIKEESTKVNHGGSKKMLTQLENYRDEYAAQVQILESHGNKASSNKSIKEIYEMIEELKKMKNCGELLREIEQLELIAVRKEQENRVTSVNIKKGWMDKMYNAVSSTFSSAKPKYNNLGKKPGNYGFRR